MMREAGLYWVRNPLGQWHCRPTSQTASGGWLDSKERINDVPSSATLYGHRPALRYAPAIRCRRFERL